MTTAPLRFAIIGPGSIAHLHCRAVKQADGADIVAVYGRDRRKTAAFAARHALDPYHNLDDLLARKDIDAVCIATASGTHLDIGLKAAAAGKHVLCEKPLEVTTARARQLIDACADRQVKLGVFFQARFDHCTRLTKDAIDSGRLGRLLMVSCQMRWFRSQDYYDAAEWRGTWELDGGGSLMNQGIHTVDLLLYLAGAADRVSAFQGPVTHQNIEVEDNLCAAVRFKNGAVGTIEASTSCAPGFPRRVMLSGDQGTIEIEGDRITRWDFVRREDDDEAILAAGRNIGQGLGGAADPLAIADDGHRLTVEDFIACIRQGREPLINGIEGRRAVELVCAVYRSLQSGRIEAV